MNRIYIFFIIEIIFIGMYSNPLLVSGNTVNYMCFIKPVSFIPSDSLKSGRNRDGKGIDNTINGPNSNGTNGTDPNTRWDNQVHHTDSVARFDTTHHIDSTGRMHNNILQLEKYSDKSFGKGKGTGIIFLCKDRLFLFKDIVFAYKKN